MDESFGLVVAYAASVSDDLVTDVIEFVCAHVVGIDVGGEPVDVGGVGNATYLSVVGRGSVAGGDVKGLVSGSFAYFF